jgi:hypothetical protein
MLSRIINIDFKLTKNYKIAFRVLCFEMKYFPRIIKCLRYKYSMILLPYLLDITLAVKIKGKIKLLPNFIMYIVILKLGENVVDV